MNKSPESSLPFPNRQPPESPPPENIQQFLLREREEIERIIKTGEIYDLLNKPVDSSIGPFN